MKKRKKILLASVLKPIDDSRMFEKFAQTLSQVASVHILGFPTQKTIPPSNEIIFHPLSMFHRTSASRWKASTQLWKVCRETQPDLLIIHAVELLPMGFFISKWLNIPLLYDIRENYWKNIIHQPIYTGISKYLLATGIRGVEFFSRLGVAHYLLAEKCYAKELPFWASVLPSLKISALCLKS